MVPKIKYDEHLIKDTKICGESNMWSTAQRYKKLKDLMLMLDLNESIDQLAMANCACWHGMAWHGHMLKR